MDEIAFFGNPTKEKRRRAIFSADGQPFRKVMKAIVSNSEAVILPNGDELVFDTVLCVVERASS